MRTQVAIVGAGPAGLLLGRLLSMSQVDTVILEGRSREYVEGRIRGGMLEHPTVQLLEEVGLDQRMRAEGAVHDGFELRFGERRHRMRTAELSGGRETVIYGQQEIVKDAIAARIAEGRPLHFEASDVCIGLIDTAHPVIEYRRGGRAETLACDFVIGCDGSHGVSRPAIPPAARRTYSATYPFVWLGVLAAVAPSTEELIYAVHERGFALHSLRSPQLSRFYLQVSTDESLAAWSDSRIWSELRVRLGDGDGWTLNEGPIIQRSMTAMRSFVCEPMQYGSLFLAGDAAHIVPPTAAKGLNLAAGDVRLLAECLVAWYEGADRGPLDRYSEMALQRVWWAQEFSRELTGLLHHEPDDVWAGRLKWAQLERLCDSIPAATAFCEQYVGMPFVRARSAQATRPELGGAITG